MPLLIDGHNLISALPGLDLADPHDEAKLVEKLKGYCGRTGQRCTVIFDGGIPGGFSRDLSNAQVRVVFAAAHRTDADTLIRRRIRASRHPAGVTVVSSDREVRAEARAHRMQVYDSATFAVLMRETMVAGKAETTDETGEKPDDVRLDPDQVDEWLRLFGES